jgi:hypothetical protein
MNAATDRMLHWDDEQELLGVRVRVHFFDAARADAAADWIDRLLPLLASTRPTALHAQGERGQYTLASLVAHPDGVFEHGNGLICLLDRSADRRPHALEHWPRQLRGDALVQALIAAMAVAGHSQRPTAAMLRCHNAIYQIDPTPAALECVAASLAPALAYCGGQAPLSVQQLAAYCEPRLRGLPAGGGPVAARAQCDIAFADTTPAVADIAN